MYEQTNDPRQAFAAEQAAQAAYVNAKTTRPFPNAAAQCANAPTDRSATAIRDALGMTDVFLQEVHEAINLIEARLDTVLLPTVPTPATTGSEQKLRASGSHVRDRVFMLNDGFSAAALRIRELARRIDV